MENKLSTTKRRKELLAILTETGPWMLNLAELGRKYGVSRTMIGKDVKLLIGQLSLSNEDMGLSVKLSLKKATARAYGLIDHGDPKIALQACLVLAKVSQAITLSKTKCIEETEQKPEPFENADLLLEYVKELNERERNRKCSVCQEKIDTLIT